MVTRPASKAQSNGFAIILTKGTKALTRQTLERVRREFSSFYERDLLQLLMLGRGQRLADPRHNLEISVPDSDRNGHFWCFGTTRVGKTRVMENMVEQDIRKGYSVVIIDPKGDIELFSKVVQVAFEEGRQEELMLVTPIFPAYSAIIDPLSHYFMPEELVGHVVSGVEVGKEKFFYNVAYEISLIVVQALVLLAKNEGKLPLFNLNDVKNRISRSELEKLKSEIDSIDSEDAKQLSSYMQKILDSPRITTGRYPHHDSLEMSMF